MEEITSSLQFVLNRYRLTGKEEPPVRIPFSRWIEFPRLINALGFKVGAEIGVEKGVFSKHLFLNVPGLKLYSIDSWAPYRSEFGYGKARTRQDRYYEEAKTRLAPFNCEVIREFSMNAVKRFEDESLDFVYIDANHDYEFVKQDIQEWSKKVRKGGIIAGDDYYVFGSGNNGVVRAVDEWVKENSIPYLFVYNKEYHPSWIFMKE